MLYIVFCNYIQYSTCCKELSSTYNQNESKSHLLTVKTATLKLKGSFFFEAFSAMECPAFHHACVLCTK